MKNISKIICLILPFFLLSCSQTSDIINFNDVENETGGVSIVLEDFAKDKTINEVDENIETTEITYSVEGIDNKEIEIYDFFENKSSVNIDDLKVITLGSECTNMWALLGGNVYATTEESLNTSIENNFISPINDVIIIGNDSNIDKEKLYEIEPNFVIFDAVTPENVTLGAELRSKGINTYFFEIKSYEDYLLVMEDFSYMLKNESEYVNSVINSKSNISDILNNVPSDFTKNVLILEIDGDKINIIEDGNFVDSIFDDFNCTNVANYDKDVLNEILDEDIDDIENTIDYIFAYSASDNYENDVETFNTYIKGSLNWLNLDVVKEGCVIELSKEMFAHTPEDKWEDNYNFLNSIFFKSEV
ncbi:MAG: hypothetical protein ACK5LY_05545 [Lachnospirales bacterium]